MFVIFDLFHFLKFFAVSFNHLINGISLTNRIDKSVILYEGINEAKDWCQLIASFFHDFEFNSFQKVFSDYAYFLFSVLVIY